MAAPRPENAPPGPDRLQQQTDNRDMFNEEGYTNPPVTLATFRTRPYPNPPAPAQNLPFPGYTPVLERDPHPVKAVVRRDRKAKNFRSRFLARPVQELRSLTNWGLKNRWKGKRILGQGGNGIVGVWKFHGPRGSHISNLPRQVVMKQQLQPATMEQNFVEEAQMSGQLSERGSSHLVELLLTPPQLQNLYPPATGIVSRLVMEYCPMGSLDNLIWRRSRQGAPFTELTLWLFFDCLVDAIAVMSEGSEYVYDDDTRTATLEDPDPTWNPMVHFDIKSPNVLLACGDDFHPDTPILKLADFGHATRIDVVNYLNNREEEWHEREYLRVRGTPGYFAPEQFSSRWNYEDWNATNPPVCGIYGTPTNIWGVGIVMFELIHLIDGVNTYFSPPIAWDPRTINYLIWGRPALGLTYGETLCGSHYSAALKHLVLECLYEAPAHRPTLARMKEIITQQIANRPGHEVENWNSFKTTDEPPSDDDEDEEEEEEEEEEEGEEGEEYVPPLRAPPLDSRRGRRRRR